ncbi:hypothetical protein OUZ56_018693 [Daphnia magna]|uniref:4-hydroxybenzoate polyprenyltransferase, mitochondrial n=1 Tax=Daphnia magna TaxID=35525 RepID=A0ABQ9Z9H9_9CRUS|nr:hypothetical protein OUZ56_018693 [Daphnia magna]
MKILIPMALALLAGALLPFQAGINAQLRGSPRCADVGGTGLVHRRHAGAAGGAADQPVAAAVESRWRAVVAMDRRRPARRQLPDSQHRADADPRCGADLRADRRRSAGDVAGAGPVRRLRAGSARSQWLACARRAADRGRRGADPEVLSAAMTIRETLPERLLICRLMRLDKPVGIYLLLWPTLWALWFAAGGLPPLHLLAIFVLGTFLMRSAGCVINDLADRRFDGHVERTRQRPLASGRATPAEALILFLVLGLVSLAVAAPLNAAALWLTVPAIALAASYPFAKRFHSLPQAHLGIAFSWGIPMAFAAVGGRVDWPMATLLMAANLCWTIAYDTLYAMVDRDDDLRIGVVQRHPVRPLRPGDRRPAAAVALLLLALPAGACCWAGSTTRACCWRRCVIASARHVLPRFSETIASVRWSFSGSPCPCRRSERGIRDAHVRSWKVRRAICRIPAGARQPDRLRACEAGGRQRRRCRRRHRGGALGGGGAAQREVSYTPPGWQKALSGDLFTPSGKAPASGWPAVIALHGGAWHKGDRSKLAGLGKRLASRGYVVLTIDYRLVPDAIYPAQLLDLQQAVRYLRPMPRRSASIRSGSRSGVRRRVPIWWRWKPPEPGRPAVRSGSAGAGGGRRRHADRFPRWRWRQRLAGALPRREEVEGRLDGVHRGLADRPCLGGRSAGVPDPRRCRHDRAASPGHRLSGCADRCWRAEHAAAAAGSRPSCWALPARMPCRRRWISSTSGSARGKRADPDVAAGRNPDGLAVRTGALMATGAAAGDDVNLDRTIR